MQRIWPAACPVCGKPMKVTRFRCPACGTTLEGDFTLGRFAGLAKDQWDFLEVFLKCRGNLREVERELGLSYPTVRSRLDELLAAMGLTPRGEPEETSPGGDPILNADFRPSTRKEVLEALSRGLVTPTQAAALLKQMKH